jgi:TatA/E family protein of Tat protein translocase
MFNLDPGKLLIIGVVAILLLGPDRLPQVARQVGTTWKSFNEFRHRMEAEVRSNIPDLPSTADLANLARSPSALLNHVGNMGSPGNSAEPAQGDEAWTTSDQRSEVPSEVGEMSWVTTDYSPQSPPSVNQHPDGGVPGSNLVVPSDTARPLESVVTGDANLN